MDEFPLLARLCFGPIAYLLECWNLRDFSVSAFLWICVLIVRFWRYVDITFLDVAIVTRVSLLMTQGGGGGDLSFTWVILDGEVDR